MEQLLCDRRSLSWYGKRQRGQPKVSLEASWSSRKAAASAHKQGGHLLTIVSSSLEKQTIGPKVGPLICSKTQRPFPISVEHRIKGLLKSGRGTAYRSLQLGGMRGLTGSRDSVDVPSCFIEGRPRRLKLESKFQGSLSGQRISQSSSSVVGGSAGTVWDQE